MADYTIAATLDQPYDAAVEAVRAALGEQGFGILTEIDLKATLKAKLDVDVAPQVILGACRPALAYEALTTEPSIAAVLPCNVVVRALDESTSVVEAFNPDTMMGMADDPGLQVVAADAKQRIVAALASLQAVEEGH
ncbi:DUF302 domain-containing protein [Nocardioides massiliensis]|uniref:Uncharacterized protein (DUF302 family) n=1 Tax=Nocardioides massiliensis TaxID=1325935 RepID=A0ABT9NUB4_9ACTN|nr:DUF302 domain-containing protein [Nocardioides massiliensis]MDP9824017.1 uncharacterized protein (DUF302 family) [Nocardioides massiliensis]